MRFTSKNTVLFYLVVIFRGSSCLQCLDKFALSSIDALVHKQKNARAIIHREENFNLLDGYISIDVIKSNVSQLCQGMVKNFPKLETLSFINANITYIEPGTFEAVPKLTYLSLSVNLLSHITRGVFNPIKSLKVIYLTNNHIETIEDGAFSQMPNLKAVHLNHNKIKELTGNILFGSTMISLVDFSFNELTTIQKNAFDDLRPSSSIAKLNILLKRNKITTVNPDALRPLIPVNLRFDGNEITRISDIVSPLKSGSEVFLSNNKIECVADDVLDLIKSVDIKIEIKTNPVQCACIERVEEALSGDMRGEINVVTTLPCSDGFPFFGNQL